MNVFVNSVKNFFALCAILRCMLERKIKKIIIVGGGFAGIRTALTLARLQPADTKIILISDKPHFEYQAALYRVVAGHSPLEVCIPLREIFSGTTVEVIEDTITQVHLKEQSLQGSSGTSYTYDYLVLSLGSETSYFKIPGIKEQSFGLKSISEALALKRHLHEIFNACERGTPEDKVCAAHIMVVGGGASGTEIAGLLGVYLRQLATQHGLDENMITIDLVEAAPRLLPFLPASASKKVKQRLQHLGVNIFLNRTVVKQELEEVFLKDIQMKTKTLIWTAGNQVNHLYSQIKGLEYDKRGRVLVDSQLRAEPWKNVFVLGDGASTPYSGTASTALDHGSTVACVLYDLLTTSTLHCHTPRQHWFSIPLGSGWAASGNGRIIFYGWLGWVFRRWFDWRFFKSILPLGKAWTVFKSDQQLAESCPICSEVDKK